MLKETNLDEVKKIAVSMLYLDIGLTDFSPMIVSHPFTSSGITMIKSDGDFKMVNLIENAADLQLWRDAIKQQISKAESAFSILFLMNKPYYFAFIKFSKSIASFSSGQLFQPCSVAPLYKDWAFISDRAF